MQDNTPRKIASNLETLCRGLKEYNHPRAAEAARLAATYGDIRTARKFAPIKLDGSDVREMSSAAGGDEGFDPSQESPSEPSMGGGAEKPEIESFVKRDPEAQMTRNIHTSTVSFIAMADNVNEEDIMQYMLDIRNHMPVKVKSFNWSVTEEKAK